MVSTIFQGGNVVPNDITATVSAAKKVGVFALGADGQTRPVTMKPGTFRLEPMSEPKGPYQSDWLVIAGTRTGKHIEAWRQDAGNPDSGLTLTGLPD